MAGGSGTRFWPASRHSRPKQFLSVAGERAMLAATRARLGTEIPDERVLVVAGIEHAALVREVLPALPEENLLLEPVGRNTLPCVALANAEILRRDPQALQIVLPADHVISPESAFHSSLQAALAVANRGSLVTFGIRPTFAATGYGYIEVGESQGKIDGWPVHRVARFVEKPDPASAEEFLAAGTFLWNGGMFVWATAAISAALAEHASATWEALRDADPRDLEQVYDGLEPQPVDVGVMERAENRAVIPVDYAWNDVGSWTSLPEVLPTDPAGNCGTGGGQLETRDARRNIVYTEPGNLTALIGVENLIVVRSGDALLVCPRSRAEEIRGLVEGLPPERR